MTDSIKTTPRPTAWTDPSTLVQIRQARDRIQLDQSAQTESVHQTVQHDFSTIVEQYRTSIDVQQRLANTASSIAELQRGLQDVESLATPLLELLRTRARHTTAKRTAANRLVALQHLQSRVSILQRAEEHLSAGKGQVDAVLELRTTGKGVEGAAVEAQLRTREKKVVAAVEAQLQDALERAVEVRDGELRLQEEVALRVVSLAETSTKTYHSHTVPLHHLVSSLSTLGLLSPLLSNVQSQLLKQIVKPLVQSYATGQNLVVRKEQGPTTRLWLAADASDGPWDSIRLILDTLSTFLPSSNSEIASFHRHIVSETLTTIRDALLLPLLSRPDSTDAPSAIDTLTRSVAMVQSAATFEESLATSSRVIRDFAENRAGSVYVGARKSYVLKRVRDEVVDKWGKWQSVVVERERILDVPEVKPSEKSAAKAAEEKPVEVEKVATLEEDGWAFDDEPIAPAPSVESATLTSDADGWGFDDDDMTTAKAPPIVAPKPIRQARKIGKKSKSANATSEGSGTASPAIDERVPTPQTDTDAEPVKADGWDMEWEPEPVAPADPVAVHERLKVSVVLDDVMAIVIDELQFVDAFQKANITLSSFASTADQLAAISSETLELVRAVVPARYETQIRDIPALAVQYANDCAWLAERVRVVLEQAASEGVAVDGLARQVDKLVALSTIVLDRQVESQTHAIADILANLEGLETTSDDAKYQLCTRAFEEVHHKLETLFRVYKDVMTESSCLTTMGRLIDSAISYICMDILAIVDITAEESERLKQLCSILRPIEERFNEMHVNIVAFVPHWLRFCYLAEIMEASLVDITYLLESGALVDFTSDELVHLLLALFTDTPNRAELIGKVMARQV